MYSGCSLTVSHCFCHQNRGLHFIIACWEFPSISSRSWPLTLHCMCKERVWGRSSPSSSARLTDRLVVPSAAPSALRLHCSALSGRAAGQLLTIVSDRPATWYRGGRRLPPSLWNTDATCICACGCVSVCTLSFNYIFLAKVLCHFPHIDVLYNMFKSVDKVL